MAQLPYSTISEKNKGHLFIGGFEITFTIIHAQDKHSTPFFFLQINIAVLMVRTK